MKFYAKIAQEWFREVSFSRLQRGVHDRLHMYPCVGLFSSHRIDTIQKGPTAYSVLSERHRQRGVNELIQISKRRSNH